MNLDSTIDIDLKGFFQWWGRELAFLVPKSLRRQLRDRQGYVIFSPSAQKPQALGFDVALFDDDENVIAQRYFDLSEANRYQQLKNQYPAIEKAEYVLRLPADQALQKVVFLPEAVQENLQQVASFELDRYTPFKTDQVYFNAVPLGNTGYGQIRVLLLVVPRSYLDEQLGFLETWGVRPQRVDYQAAVVDFSQIRDAYNLLPERYRQRGSKLSQSAHWLVSVLLMLLLLAALIWPVWMQGQEVESLKARIRQLEKQNQVVDAQQAEIDALRAETQKLIDIKRQSPALLPVLNELSNLLNDETWLTHMQFSGQHMQIQGQSPAASALISVLESSEFFNNVSFVSPLTQDKISGRERFQISMDISMPVSTQSDEEPSSSAEQETNEAVSGQEQPSDEADLGATEEVVGE